MIDGKAANPSPDPNPEIFPGLVNSDPQDGGSSPWETLTFPDQLAIADINGPGNTMESFPTAAGSKPPGAEQATTLGQPNPEHLVTLIQDLNHCNDALLQRVGELEEALERSQAALQSELERNQGQPSSAPVTPPQIAQLLSELEITNDGLRRTAIHNQTLQSELEVGHQRIAQLERECTLLQNRLSEKSAALVKADASCRDLKSRLHRQQQYTLQFKAALEKCLNTAPASIPDSEVNPGLAMPKADQIKPWSLMTQVQTEQSSLMPLWNSLKSHQKASPPAPGTELQPSMEPFDHPSGGVSLPPPATPPVKSGAPIPDSTVVQDPWQTPSVDLPLPRETLTPDAAFTEPSPWGTPVPSELPPPQPKLEPEATTTAVTSEDVQLDALTSPAVKLPSQPVPPSPVGTTLPQRPTNYHQASPSPLVYPLRSPKKITSLAAVQLPNFGRQRQS